MSKILPVILAGGTGSRLWPLSRTMYPKQLLQLTDENSLLQTTLLRVAQLSDVLPPIVVVGEDHRFITRTQMDELAGVPGYTILLEPVGRNTAPAICGAAHYCATDLDEDVVMLVLPADHIVTKPDAFCEAVKTAVSLAAKGAIVTFGIEPTSPETGYGYIERGEDYAVRSFKEKPELKVAKEYLASGNYFWNSGMFAFTVQTFLKEMDEHSPEMLEDMREAVKNGVRDDVFYRFGMAEMSRCADDSIDYALMEKTSKAAVVAADLGWSDIGSWHALWEVLEKDEAGNVTQGDVLLEDTENCLVRSEGSLVTAVGLKDTVVIETADAILVAPMSKSQEVKKIVTRLKKDKRSEYNYHRTVYRPWGSYTVLDEQERYQMKRITVNPGAKLSLQKHHHRYEHWVVVAGTAEVTNGDEVLLLNENESTYIPLGVVHRLENPGVIPLELIEVQIGSYLGEDDIVRYEDVYGREQE